MGLLDDLDAAEGPKRWPCKFCAILADLDPETRERVAASPLGYEPLAALLTAHGHPISGHSVKRHRTQGHDTP